MNIALIGGTGREGRGLAVRWAAATHTVRIGSRHAERGQSAAAELAQKSGYEIRGGDNAWAARGADAIVLCVPYKAHRETLTALRHVLLSQGKSEPRLVIDITVPLCPPRVSQVHVPEGKAAALESQSILGSLAHVVAALHHVSSMHLQDATHALVCDVLVCGDDESAKRTAMSLIDGLPARTLDAGPLCNAVALEALTPVLLHLNKRYRGGGVGVRFTGIPTATSVTATSNVEVGAHA